MKKVLLVAGIFTMLFGTNVLAAECDTQNVQNNAYNVKMVTLSPNGDCNTIQNIINANNSNTVQDIIKNVNNGNCDAVNNIINSNGAVNINNQVTNWLNENGVNLSNWNIKTPGVTTEATTKAPVVVTETKPEATTKAPVVTTEPKAEATTKAPVVTTEPKTEATTKATSSNSSYANQILNLVNQERSKNGLGSLTLASDVSNVAQAKAQDMADKNYFSHTSPTYGSPFDMMKQFGVSYRTAGENIAKGQKTPAEVMNAWMNSEGHRANILNSSFTKLGVGYTEKNGSTYWVQMFIG